MKHTFLLFAILILTAATAPCQPSSLSPGKKHKLDSFFSVLEKHSLFNGTVAVIEKGQLIYNKSAGYWNMEEKVPNSTTTSFNLASVSKPFTSLAVLQLVQKKKVSLDDALVKYLPSFPHASITIRNLLNHTSGLRVMEQMANAYTSQQRGTIVTSDKMYELLLAQNDTLVAEPGNRWQYNNLNYALLAMLVEKVSRMSFADYMKKHIFDVAGMNKTFVRLAGDANTPRYIFPGYYEGKRKHVDSIRAEAIWTDYALGSIPGSNNVVSTVEDMVKFEQALRSGKIVSLPLLQEAFSPTVFKSGKTFYLGGARSYGLGWNVVQDPGKDTVVFHDGHIPGLTSMYFKNLNKDQVVIYYDNTESWGMFPKVSNVTRILNDLPLTNIPLKRSVARAYGPLLKTKGIDYATMKLHELRADTANYYLDELQLNTLAYDLNNASFPGHIELALEVGKLNTLLYKSANSFDTYGDILKQAGKKEEAILAYERCLALNPKTENARTSLAALKGAKQ